MKRILRRCYSLLVMFGIDPYRAYLALTGLPAYCRDFMTLRQQARSARTRFPFAKPYPCLDDRADGSGSASGHYFHQDLLVARRIFTDKPVRHIDVGSRIDGFVAHVAVFREIEVMDIRPLPNTIPNVKFLQADLMQPLAESYAGCCDSLSCLHALEHFGLGRYGDPVMYDGYARGLDNLHTMLKPGGKLYLSVPMGPQRIEFNAHRVFSLEFLLACVAGRFQIDRASYVDDKGDLHDDVALDSAAAKDNYGCHYGCCILELTKL